MGIRNDFFQKFKKEKNIEPQLKIEYSYEKVCKREVQEKYHYIQVSKTSPCVVEVIKPGADLELCQGGDYFMLSLK